MLFGVLTVFMLLANNIQASTALSNYGTVEKGAGGYYGYFDQRLEAKDGAHPMGYESRGYLQYDVSGLNLENLNMLELNMYVNSWSYWRGRVHPILDINLVNISNWESSVINSRSFYDATSTPLIQNVENLHQEVGSWHTFELDVSGIDWGTFLADNVITLELDQVASGDPYWSAVLVFGAGQNAPTLASAVPLPPSIFLFSTGLVTLLGLKRRS